MSTVLIMLAILFGLSSVFRVTEATEGVWAICVACLFAILGRVAQSSRQHAEIVRIMIHGPPTEDDLEDLALKNSRVKDLVIVVIAVILIAIFLAIVR